MVAKESQRGQALAEFAFVAPALFLLLFAVIQLGLLMSAQNGLVNGVRDSTRRAATYRVSDVSFYGGNTLGAVCANIKTELVYRLSAEIPGFVAGRLSPAPRIKYDWVQEPSGTYSLMARITATYQEPLILPLDPLLDLWIGRDTGRFGNSYPLKASEQMRVENPPMSPSDLTTQMCP